MKKVIVIAPHPDDELIGCGGTLLRYASENKRIGWIIVTSMQEKYGWSLEKIKERDNEIKQVGKGLKIQQKNIFQLNFPTVRLDTIPMEKIVKKLSHIIKDFEPNEIFIPKLRAYTIKDMKEALFELLQKTDEENIGIREGEKLNETLINSDEIRYTWEYENMYMVLNPSVQKYVSINQYPNASKITTMSEYSSDSVEKFSIEEMKKIILNANLLSM